jgi:transposase
MEQDGVFVPGKADRPGANRRGRPVVCGSGALDCAHRQSMAPPSFGKWNSVYQRFRYWVKADVFKRMFEAVADDPDMEYAMVDATIVKVHRHGQGAKGGLRARPSATPKAA